MSDLLSSVLKAHGGLENWQKVKSGGVTMVSGGELLDRKAPQKPEPRRCTVSLHEQFLSVTPFGKADKCGVFTTHRVAIETINGELISERTDPRQSFVGHDLDTKWDPLDRAYFNGYAMWIYLTAPFMFAMPGVRTEEISPLVHDGERWRGLRVTLPPNIASHSTVQKFYFGHDCLLRRQDYTLDIAGGCNVAHYVHDIGSFDGFLMPTKRRAYLCDNEYNVLRDRLLIWIDLSQYEYR